MNDQLREEARRKLIDEKVGLISQDDLVSWADDKLLELEEAPDFLISISLREPLYHIRRLDLVKDRVVDDDCQSLAKRIIQAFESGLSSSTILSSINEIKTLLQSISDSESSLNIFNGLLPPHTSNVACPFSSIEFFKIFCI